MIKYTVEGEPFSFCCDASEKSFQLCKKFIRNQENQKNLRVVEAGDKSYQVYDSKTKEILYVCMVKDA